MDKVYSLVNLDPSLHSVYSCGCLSRRNKRSSWYKIIK